MSRNGKILRWVGIALSLPVSIFAGGNFIYYVWLNAADPERWPAEKVAIWAYTSLAVAILFLGVFIICVVSLKNEANRKYRAEQTT